MSGSFVITASTGQVESCFEAQIAIGQNADELSMTRHGNARDPIALHQFERVGDLLFRLDRDRIDDHAALSALYAVDFFRLTLDAHVLVDDADAALLGQRDREVRLGHRVHGRAEDRDV